MNQSYSVFNKFKEKSKLCKNKITKGFCLEETVSGKKKGDREEKMNHKYNKNNSNSEYMMRKMMRSYMENNSHKEDIVFDELQFLNNSEDSCKRKTFEKVESPLEHYIFENMISNHQVNVAGNEKKSVNNEDHESRVISIEKSNVVKSECRPGQTIPKKKNIFLTFCKGLSNKNDDVNNTVNDMKNSFLNLGLKNLGPKVRPFIFSQMQKSCFRFKVPFYNYKCQICDDSFQIELMNDKPLPLKCGDFVHKECYTVIINHEIQKHDRSVGLTVEIILNNDFIDLFSECKGSICQQTKISGRLVLLDDNLFKSLVEKALLDQDVEPERVNSVNLLPLESRSIKLNKSDSSLDSLKDNNNYSKSKLINNNFDFKSNQLDLDETSKDYYNDDDNNDSEQYNSYNEEIESLYNGNKNASSNSILTRNNSFYTQTSSNSVLDPVKCIHISSIYKNIELQLLKEKFLNYLLNNCINFNRDDLLNVGFLRLADLLTVKLKINDNDMKKFEKKIVYFFEKCLVIWSIKHLNPIFFYLNSILIETPSPSVLSITQKNSNSVSQYIWLKSKDKSVLEKWVIAASNIHFKFPPKMFTSTIVLPEYHHLNTYSNLLDRSESYKKENNSSDQKNTETFLKEDIDSLIKVFDGSSYLTNDLNLSETDTNISNTGVASDQFSGNYYNLTYEMTNSSDKNYYNSDDKQESSDFYDKQIENDSMNYMISETDIDSDEEIINKLKILYKEEHLIG